MKINKRIAYDKNDVWCGKRITLEWMQPYDNHGWWVLGGNTRYGEKWFGYAESFALRIKYGIGYKLANQEFDRLKGEFNLIELKEGEKDLFFTKRKIGKRFETDEELLVRII